MTDEFREVPGFPNYSVNRLGVLKRSHFLKPRISRIGYVSYCVRVDGKQRTLLAHRAVALAWITKNDPERTCVAHLDGDKLNNNVSNLAWTTHAENERHKVAHGTVLLGRKNPAAKLDEQQVREMVSLRRKGETFQAIGSRLGVTPQAAFDATRGRNWKHLRALMDDKEER